ncbi:MAG: hypothetical protein ABIG63_14905 [Chloroflexota bacterium]
MKEDKHIWQVWADLLCRWGVQDIVAALLEATGPLNLLGAQAVYLGQPLLNQILPAGHLDALANLLEDPEEIQAFSSFLRQKSKA